jgi:hypothetical protein
MINAVYAEPNTPRSKETYQAVADAIEELSAFLGAKEILHSSCSIRMEEHTVVDTCGNGVFAPCSSLDRQEFEGRTD